MPGDLHKLWRARDPKEYHVEYGYSCMGYEIAGGLGVKLALDGSRPARCSSLVGDGSYLMMSSEIVTAVQEGVKLVVVLVQNHGFASIGALSESVGRSGSAPATATAPSGLDGDVLPVDLAANAASLGADVLPHGLRELRTSTAPRRAPRSCTSRPTRSARAGRRGWWDVPVAEVSDWTPSRGTRPLREGQTGAAPYL